MSDCVHDNGEYCEVISDKEVRQPCLETPLCEDYKEIVRCKDCKYSTEPDAYGLRVCRRMCGLSGFTDYDFCSKGERRDEID